MEGHENGQRREQHLWNPIRARNLGKNQARVWMILKTNHIISAYSDWIAAEKGGIGKMQKVRTPASSELTGLNAENYFTAQDPPPLPPRPARTPNENSSCSLQEIVA